MIAPIGRLLAVSVLSTLAMDVGAVLGSKLRLTGPTPGRLAPRWIAAALRGRMLHRDIASVPAIRGELPTALVVHHLIGLVLTTVYLSTAGAAGLAGNVAVGIGYGVATSAFAWLFMFPSMGYGAFGLRAPRGTTPIRTTAFNHACFGLGLAMWSRALLHG